MGTERLVSAAKDDQELSDIHLQQQFGANFRDARKALGLTQAQVSQLTNIHRTAISEIEHGQVNLTLLTMRRLASVVHQEVSHLLGNSSKVSKQK